MEASEATCRRLLQLVLRRMSDDIEDDVARPKSPLDYISRDQLQDMWGAGFTVIRRNTFGHDVYELADRVKRPGMARQWVDAADVEKFKADAWRQIYCESYPGLFAPFGYIGPVEIGGLFLFECPQHRVDKAKKSAEAAAHKLVTDWEEKWGGHFSGEVTVAGQTELGKLDTLQTTKIGATKTIENITAIPRDFIPYIGRIFEERDALYNDLVEKWNSGQELTAWQDSIRKAYNVQLAFNKDSPLQPTLNALIMPTAIDNIRKRITEEAGSAEASDD
jgi:hypothetical protein